MLPRFKGRAGQGDDGKYYFEISMWNFEGTEMIENEPLGIFGPFETDEIAKKELNKAIQIAVKAVRGPDGEAPNGYMDMKNGGEFIPFMKH